MRWSYVAAALALAVLIIIGVIAWDALRTEAPAPTLVETAPQPKAAPIDDPPPTLTEPAQPQAPETPAEPELVLPALEESDAFAREQIGADPSELARTWLEQEDLLRRAAVILDNASRGEYPRGQIAFVKVRGPFKVVTRGEHHYVDASSYQRYDAVVDALISVPPERTAALIGLFEPLIVEALRELGVRAESVDRSIQDALASILATPMLTSNTELMRPNVLYEYADPTLENLKPLQKQLLRAGPKNLAKLQRYARELTIALQD